LKRRISIAAVVLVTLACCAPAAQAAPSVEGSWPTSVTGTGAVLWSEVNPQGSAASYRFEYTPESTFLAQGFSGASTLPPGSEIGISAGTSTKIISQPVGGLQNGTTYRFRIVVTSGGVPTAGPTRSFTTSEPPAPFALADGRAWEMVSPVEKNGGEIQGFEGNFGGGVLQAAAAGGAITYTSSFSFLANPQGSPGASQYLSRRGADAWGTENITPPGLSGTYPETPTSGVPYQIFSPDLAAALMNNGRRCRNETTKPCPVENPPLAGSGAPAGYRNYYRRNNTSGSFEAILNSADLADLALGPEDFELELAGETPDLAHVVLSTCAALTADAVEVPGTEGECDPEEANLYEKTGGALKLINLEPLATTGTPGAALAAQSRAISSDGSRIYWTAGGELFVRNGNATESVAGPGGGTPEFQTASADGSIAYYIQSGHIFRYELGVGSTDLTPGGQALGVLGASEDGAWLYYATSAGLFLWHSGTSSSIVSSVDPATYAPPAGTGAARVSADGRHLVFVSSALAPTGYDNRDANSGLPVAEVYLYTAPGSGSGEGTISCVSCRPSGERPGAGIPGFRADSSIPGASFNGPGFNQPHSYKPRVLSADSRRVFFESYDALVAHDTNKTRDVYQWEAQGSGSCTRLTGCVSLISSGQAQNGASFVDASSDGGDAFFLTDGSLVPSDPGSVDVYDARVGGGFPQPPTPIPCFGDACQPLPAEPEDPTPGTLRSSRPNPPAVQRKPIKCKKGQIKRKGKCKKRKVHKRHGRHGGRR
jgi:hypothetical protein